MYGILNNFHRQRKGAIQPFFFYLHQGILTPEESGNH